ncbi:MAG: glucosaminidase domain-containing protein [Propionibacteriaceae bacterium]|nr:glucosaminidase domain-containing protein [Propionibacteriaceae bacterium]
MNLHFGSSGRSAWRLCAGLIVTLGIFAGTQPTKAHAVPPNEFISWIAPMAQRGEREHGVPSSVTIAQAILESGWGESKLTKEANSFFGIKCFKRVSPYQDGCYNIATKEYDDQGHSYGTSAWFRKYRTAERSVLDHGHFLRNNSRYAPAFKYTSNPDRFAFEIHKAGYATDPGYTSLLISLMRQYGLYRYDVTAASGKTLRPDVLAVPSRATTYGATERWTVTFYGSPSPQVTWQESRNGGASWKTISSGVKSYGFRSVYTRTIGSDNGVLLRLVVKNSAGTAVSAPGKITVSGAPSGNSGQGSHGGTKPSPNKPVATGFSLTSHAPGKYHPAGSVSFSGRGTPGAKVSIKVNRVVRSATVGANGTWRLRAMPVAAQGADFVFTMTHKGKTTSHPVTLFFGPAPASLSQPKLLSPRGATPAGKTVRLQGTGTPGTKLTIRIGSRVRTAYVRSNGKWGTGPFPVSRGRVTATVVTEAPGRASLHSTWRLRFT